MDNLYEFMKRYKCNYSNDKDLKKAIIKAKSKEELEKYLQDEGTFVDCGMSTTGLVILYLHSLVENESDIRNIEDLLKDPTNPEENFYTIPTDGIVEKNMLIRILPKNNIENSDLKIRYFRTNYLQDKLLPLNLGFTSTSWGMWCLEIGTIEESIPDELLFRDRDSYVKDTILYAFFNGKDERFSYNWVIGSKEDIETVTEEACIRDLEKNLVGFKDYTLAKKSNISMIKNNLLSIHLRMIKANPKILDITLQDSFTHYIPNVFNLKIATDYIVNYADSLMNLGNMYSLRKTKKNFL